jgi:hypothetical protein
MAIFSDAFKQSEASRTHRVSWGACLLGDPATDMDTRMELAIRMMSPPVSHALLKLLGSECSDQVFDGLGAYWAICVAGLQGWRAVRVSEVGRVLVKNDGFEAEILPVSLELTTTGPFQQELIRRLIRQLETVIEGRRFVLHIKRDLPDVFDPLVMVSPVQNWINDIDNGLWAGGYALYEDEQVALELCLLDETSGETHGGLLFHVPPIETEGVLRQTIPEMVGALDSLTDTTTPVIVLLLGREPWTWTPGLVLNVLYGRCTSKFVDAEGVSTQNFVLNGMSLMANELCKPLGAIWWLEPSDTSELVRGVSYVNPWSTARVPAFPGVEFQGSVSSDQQEEVQLVKQPVGTGLAQLTALRSLNR